MRTVRAPHKPFSSPFLLMFCGEQVYHTESVRVSVRVRARVSVVSVRVRVRVRYEYLRTRNYLE